MTPQGTIDKLLEQGAVLLQVEGPLRPSEYGKRWMDRVWTDLDKHADVIRDVAYMYDPTLRPGAIEQRQSEEIEFWAAMEEALREEGVPTAITSGVSQYGMSHLIDHLNGKTSFTMPTTVALALATAAPTSTTTGGSVTEAAYTGYARVAIAGAGWNAATAATPSIATNVSTITFGACTAGTSTLAGFILVDSTTLAAGNSLWYGTLTSVVISTTQTPPTVAAAALSVQMTGT